MGNDPVDDRLVRRNADRATAHQVRQLGPVDLISVCDDVGFDGQSIS